MLFDERQLRDVCQAARNDLYSERVEISVLIRARKEEAKNALRKQQVPKREHLNQFRQYADFDDETRRRVARSGQNSRTASFRIYFWSSTLRNNFVCRYIFKFLNLSKQFLVNRFIYARKITSLADSHRAPFAFDPSVKGLSVPMTRYQSLALSDSASSFEHSFHCLIPRQTADQEHAYLLSIQHCHDHFPLYRFGYSTNSWYQHLARFWKSDYLARSTSLDVPGFLLDDAIDCLSKCLKLVVAANLAGCRIFSQAFCSQLHTAEERSVYSYPQNALLSVFAYSSSVIRFWLLRRPSLWPICRLAMSGASVTFRITTLLVVIRQDSKVSHQQVS